MGLDPAPDQTADGTLDLPTPGHVCREPELEEKVRHLEKALVSNRRIGAAVGIAMVGLKVDDRTAFAAIVRISQRTNRPVVEIADWILHLGRLPDAP